MLQVATTALLAFSPPTIRSAAFRAPLAMQNRPFPDAAPAAATSIATLLATVPVPAMAEDGGGIGDVILNSVLSVLVFGLIAFIVKFALEAAKVTIDEAKAVNEYYAENAPPKVKQQRSKEPVYDDSGTGAVSAEQIRKEIDYREKYGDGSKQRVGGKAVAPWMDIDEGLVAKMKKEREARKKRERGM